MILKRLIISGKIQFGGNERLKIYGALSCSSGKRLKKVYRVFFANEGEAMEMGYRPCGHCQREEYIKWKIRNNQVED